MLYLILIRCGPLARFWCMRYESKHNYFKEFAHQVWCFKNIPLTLVNHHQRLFCPYSNSIDDNLLQKNVTTSPGQYVNLNDIIII